MRRILLWLIYRVMLRTLLKLFAGIRFIHHENILYDKPCIIVANHNSHLDTITIMASLPTRQLIKTRPVAAGDYFGKTKFKERLSNFFINALLIPRQRPKDGEEGQDPIQMMLDALDNGNSLILFPEGSRGEPEKLQHFKRGIGLLLQDRGDIPFIPVYMRGLGKVLPKGDPLPVPHESMIIFGKPTFTDSNDPELIVDQVHTEIVSLIDEIDQPED